MPRAGLTPDVVVARAGDLADTTGYETLNLALLADQLGVRVPSLYKHVAGLPDLQRRLALAGMRDLHTALAQATAGRAGQDALVAVAGAYRGYAHTHPGRYTAAQRAPSPDEHELRQVSEALTHRLLQVLRHYRNDQHGNNRPDDDPHDGDPDHDDRHDDDVHAARAVRSALHGFVSLEAAGGFGLPQDLDASYQYLVTMLDKSLRIGRPSGARP